MTVFMNHWWWWWVMLVATILGSPQSGDSVDESCQLIADNLVGVGGAVSCLL